MARATPVLEAPPEAPKEYAPVYFIVVPGPAYKEMSDVAAKRNMTLAQLVSNAFSEYLKKTEGV